MLALNTQQKKLRRTMMNIEQLAIEAGVIYVDEGVLHSSLYWTDNNAIEVLDKFAQAVIMEWLKENSDD